VHLGVGLAQSFLVPFEKTNWIESIIDDLEFKKILFNKRKIDSKIMQ